MDDSIKRNIEEAIRKGSADSTAFTIREIDRLCKAHITEDSIMMIDKLQGHFEDIADQFDTISDCTDGVYPTISKNASDFASRLIEATDMIRALRSTIENMDVNSMATSLEDDLN